MREYDPEQWDACASCGGWPYGEIGGPIRYEGCKACDNQGWLAKPFVSEADLVAQFLREIERDKATAKNWTIYPETADWDLLLVHADGYQLGIEAKMSLNAKVIDQALSGAWSTWGPDGPDYRAVLVPRGKIQAHLERICRAIGVGILISERIKPGHYRSLGLPEEEHGFRDWPNWMPSQRCKLPDYVPDVSAGHKSPVKLTAWKIKAIKLMILLEKRGAVHRSDMRAIGISPSMWCDHHGGYLARTSNGYVRCDKTPDFRDQHPVNYAQIEADFDNWNPYKGDENA